MSITRHSIQIDSQGVKQTEAELRALDAADKRVEASLNDVADAANKAAVSVTKVGAASQTAAMAASGAVENIKSKFEKLDNTVSKVMGATNTLGDVFKLVGMGVGVGALVGGFADIVEVGTQLIDVFDKTGERLQTQINYYQSLSKSIDDAREAAAELYAEQKSAYSTAYVAALTKTGAGSQAGSLAAQIAKDKKLREELVNFVSDAALQGGGATGASGFMSKEQLAEQANARLVAAQLREGLQARQEAAGLSGLFLEPPPGMAPWAQEKFWETWGPAIEAIRQADDYARSLDKNTTSLEQAQLEIRQLTEAITENTATLNTLAGPGEKKEGAKKEGAKKATKPKTLYEDLEGMGFDKPLVTVKDFVLDVTGIGKQEAEKKAAAEKRAEEAKKAAEAWDAKSQKIKDAAERTNRAALGIRDMRFGALADTPTAAKFLSQAGFAASAARESEVSAMQNEGFTRVDLSQSFRYEARTNEARTSEIIGALEAIEDAYDRGYISLSDVKKSTEDLFDLLASEDFSAASGAIEELKQSFDTLDLASSNAWENMVFGLKNLGRELAAEAANISGIIASTVGALTSGVGSMITNLIVAGDAGAKSIKKTIGNALAGISAQAFGYSILLAALGTASAVGIVGLPAAPGLFAASGVMLGAGATLAGMARAFGADQIGAQAGGAKATGGKSGGTQFNGLAPTRPNDQPINVTVVLSDEGVYDGMVRVDRRRAMSGSSRPRMAGAF